MEILQELLSLIISLLYIIFSPIGIIFIAYFSVSVIKKKKYLHSSYYAITQIPFSDVTKDKGTYGEYLIYKELKHFEAVGGRFLFNAYIPKNDNTTTEVDVLLICSKGVFVIESKNYSGWIHGSEDQRNWYQTLPSSRGMVQKEKFYNPIMQNQSHIKYLNILIGEKLVTHSAVVFSNRCKLKNINVKRTDVIITNRSNLNSIIKMCYEKLPDIFTESDVDRIFNVLYPYTQISKEEREKHIAEIRKNTYLAGKYRQFTSPITYAHDECISNKTQEQIEALQADIDNMPRVGENNNYCAESNSKTEMLCPICGGRLVLRTANRGAYKGNQFWGCVNYPKCKYILNQTQKSDG